MIDQKEVVKRIQARIKEQQRKRYYYEDSGNARSAELAEFHENGLQEALDIVHGKDKPAPARPVRIREPEPAKVKPTVWRTKDGQEIPIRKMTDNHLRNTIKFLRLTAGAKVQKLQFAYNPFQGEMASDSFEQAQSRAHEEPEEMAEEYLRSIPQWPHLLKEAKRRWNSETGDDLNG